MILALVTLAGLAALIYVTTTLYNRPPGRHAWSPDMEVEFIEDDDEIGA